METLSLASQLVQSTVLNFLRATRDYILHYEQAQTRQVPRRDGWYDLSCHFPWIGARTTDLDGGHIEFFRGIANPIGVKIGTHDVDY